MESFAIGKKADYFVKRGWNMRGPVLTVESRSGLDLGLMVSQTTSLGHPAPSGGMVTRVRNAMLR